MILLRWLAATLLVILGGVVGLLGLVLTATVILLPLGIPLLMLAGRLLGWAGQLVLPSWLRHPLREFRDAVNAIGSRLRSWWHRVARRAGRRGRRLGRSRSARDAAKAVKPRHRHLLRRLFG